MEQAAAASRYYCGGGGISKQQIQHLSGAGAGAQHSQATHTGPSS